RLGYIFFYNINYYFSNPLSIIKIWEGGMSFHGAFIGCLLSIIYFTNKHKISLFKVTDLICLTAPVGICLGRIANFLNKELIGRETNFMISVRYPNEDFYRHVSQIYESLLEGILPFIALNIIYFFFKVKTGLVTGLFLINYALVRVMIEFIREPDIHIGFIFTYFTVAQILSIPILILGLVITFQCLYNKK
ncbi:MAG: prolipoprotein diacylglyceryl transferase, partial [Proteobacteria bacterium]|nr:prolipoprotein diacylglyceryl transferase [Pseudomonadota bacterium]